MDRLTVRALSIIDPVEARAIVSKISLGVGSGQRLALLGPSGSGKTSILRAIAGFIPRSRRWVQWGHERRIMTGQVCVDGSDVTELPPSERRISLVPQNLALFPDKTVLDNIAFPIWVRFNSWRVARTHAQTLIEKLSLTDISTRRPHEISGGQQQRVAVGRALIAKPSLVLFDEPLSGVDGETKSAVIELINESLCLTDAAAIFVTHDASEAEALCDQIAFLHNGRIDQVASPLEAYHQPATPYIASTFSGFETLVRGELHQNERFAPSGSKGFWKMPYSASRTYSIGTLACRPSAFRFTSNSTSGVTAKVIGRQIREGIEYLRVLIAPDVTVLCTTEKQIALSTVGSVEIGLAGDGVRFYPDLDARLSIV